MSLKKASEIKLSVLYPNFYGLNDEAKALRRRYGHMIIL